MSTPWEIGPVPIALTVVSAPVYLFCLFTRRDRPIALGASSFQLGIFTTAAIGARYFDGYSYVASFVAVQLIASVVTVVLFVLRKRQTWAPIWSPVRLDPKDLERLRGSARGSLLVLVFLNVMNYFIGPKPTCSDGYGSYSTMKCVDSHALFGSENSLFFAFYLGGALTSMCLTLSVLALLQLARNAWLTQKR